MGFPERLMGAIAAKGMTQAAVAEAVGASPAAVSAWCSGRKRPSAKNIEALARILDVAGGWLQFGDGPPPTVNPALERSRYADAVLWYHRTAPPDRGRELGNAAGFAFDNDLRT